VIAHQYSPVQWLMLAAEAAKGSDDPHTQNGAVLVPAVASYAVLAANRLPKRVAGTPARLERPAKYRYIEHAERAVIYRAAKLGTPTDGATLYCPWFACTDCARAIISAGIVRVVGHAGARRATPGRWRDEIAQADEMLREAGVQTALIEDSLGVAITFDGSRLLL
jgi:dCMP deaminase